LDIVADHDPAAATEIILMDDAEVDDVLDTFKRNPGSGSCCNKCNFQAL
jgi:hypothetical protein